MSERQYAFVDGEWLDMWNKGVRATSAEQVLMDGWCGCGGVDTIRNALLTALKRAAVKDWQPCNDVAAWMVAYRLDELGLTEHGTIVDFAWITFAGKALLGLPESEPE